MRFVLQTPSLQHLAGVKLVSEAWNRHDIRTRIERAFKDLHESVEDEYYLTNEHREWLTIEKKVESHVSALPLLPSCIEQLVNLIKPLGREIMNWSYYYYGDFENFQNSPFLENLFLQPFRWTMRGTVDYQKTAELMAKNEGLSVEKRFEVACVNSLEAEARELFTSMGRERKRFYQFKSLVVFFCGSINIEADECRSVLASRYPASSIKKRLFIASLCEGDRAMCETLFHSLNPEEKKQVLFECPASVCRDPTGHLLYYLSLMNEEQREGMFEECTKDLLIRLLEWPVQSLFLETATRGWHTMAKSSCCWVLRAIVDKIRTGFRDYDYARLFWEASCLCSADQKRYLLHRMNFVREFLETEREDFVRFVLNEAPCRLIEKLVKNSNYYGAGRVLMDETVISEAALMECTEAALVSLKDAGNEDKRLRSQKLWRLEVVIVLLKKRSQIRESSMDN